MRSSFYGITSSVHKGRSVLGCIHIDTSILLVFVPIRVIRTSEARTCASFTESRSLVHAHTRNSVAGENCEITLKVECLAKVYPANAGIMLRVAVFDKIASYMPMSHVL